MKKYLIYKLCIISIFLCFIVSNSWCDWSDLKGGIEKDFAGSPSDASDITPKVSYKSEFAPSRWNENRIDQTIIIDCKIPGFIKESVTRNNRKYSRLTLLNNWPTFHGPGKPALPYRKIIIPIPNNYHIEYDKLLIREEQNARIKNMLIIPSPTLFYLNGRETYNHIEDQTTYANINLNYPERIFEIKTIVSRDKKYLSVTLNPFQFNYLKRELIVTNKLRLEINLMPLKVESRSFFNTGKNKPKNYLILCADKYSENTKLNEFIAWKKQKGYNVRKLLKSEIRQDPSKTFSANLIGYFQHLQSEKYPYYLLIIGNNSDIPGKKGAIVIGEVGEVYTDLYYSFKRIPNMDSQPDLFYGRLPVENDDELSVILDKILTMDVNPPKELKYYGSALITGVLEDRVGEKNRADRLFFETNDLISTFLQKRINGKNFNVNEIIVNKDSVDLDCKWNLEDSLLWKNMHGSMDNSLYTIGEDRFNRLIDPSKVAVDEIKNEIIKSFNRGVNLVQYRGHGLIDRWEYFNLTSDDIMSKFNNIESKIHPFVISTACQTGTFYYPNFYNDTLHCFASTLLKKNNGGANAVIASMNNSHSKFTDIFTHGMYTVMFPDYISFQNTFTNNSETPVWPEKLPKPDFLSPDTRFGSILNYGKMYLLQIYKNNKMVKHIKERYHLFGDPESAPLFHPPEEFRIDTEYNGAFDKEILVKVNHGKTDEPISGALVCLYNENEKVHQAQTTENTGELEFTVGSEVSEVIVTVTKPGMMPQWKTINLGE